MASKLIKCVLVLAVVFVLSNQVNCEKEQDVEALLNSESNGALLLKHVVKAYSRVLAENAKLRRENSELVEFISEGKEDVYGRAEKRAMKNIALGFGKK